MGRWRKWKPLAIAIAGLGASAALLVRVHGPLAQLAATYSDIRPPIWYMAQSGAAITEALPLISLVAVVALVVRIRRRPDEPDWGMVDWQSAGPILRDLYCPAQGRKDRKDYGADAGAWQQIAEISEILDQLEVCDDEHLPAAIIREWESYPAEDRRRLQWLVDGTGDKEEWIAIYTERLEEQIQVFLSVAEEFIKWYQSNCPAP